MAAVRAIAEIGDIFRQAEALLEVESLQKPESPQSPESSEGPLPAPTSSSEAGQGPTEGEPMTLSEGLDFCLSRETDPETQLTCAAYMVAEPDDEKCPDHMIMLTQLGCVYCDRAKNRYKDLMDKGLVVELDIHSERGKKLAAAAKIDFTPGLLVVGCKDNLRASLDNALHPKLVWREDGHHEHVPETT